MASDSPAVAAETLQRLRASYPVFVYAGYEWQWASPSELCCSFAFRVGEFTFRPSCNVSFRGALPIHKTTDEVVDNLVFHLGLAEIPSYWKATCSPRIEVKAGACDDAFWKDLLTKGMGEFHYVNQTRFNEPSFLSFRSLAGAPRPMRYEGELDTGKFDKGKFDTGKFGDEKLDAGFVVPVGGGKDSLLTLELLRRRSKRVVALAINPPPSTFAAINAADIESFVVVERRIDPRLLELNKAGFLNGHTPFGAVIGFASALAAVLLRCEHIALANESSANYATLEYRGALINHQYAKSTDFELSLRRYLRSHLAPQLHYFSALRPFNEIQIAQAFAAQTKLHDVFRSCNRGRRTDSWCGACHKCLSTFILLAPFMAKVVDALGKDLLRDARCRALLPSLLGEGEVRPFECVATPAELRAALSLRATAPRFESARFESARLESPHSVLQLLAPDDEADWSGVPTHLRAPFEAALRPRISPLLRGASVGVLGFGREGESTCRFLLKNVADVEITVVDDDMGAKERLAAVFSTELESGQLRFVHGSHFALLEDEHNDFTDEKGEADLAFDVLFASPGVSPTHPLRFACRRHGTLVASNTALFFELCRGTIIGVTGTKGKSTATSLIAHVLADAGRDVRLAGNVGRPCLDALEGDDADSLYCVELSSFQLEALHTSPHIAVVLGLFPDHLDRHGDMNSYVAAKSSITRYQSRQDMTFFYGECSRAAELAALSPGKSISFDSEAPALLHGEAPLLGRFNHANLWPAIHVGRAFGLADAEIAASIRSFRPLPGRLETVAKARGVRFVCDIRSTAPEVTVAALCAFAESNEEVRFLLLGGVDRRQDYRTLLPALKGSPVKHILLFPPTGALIRRVIDEAGLSSRFHFHEPTSMEEAIRSVYERASGSACVCLMSTAAPSNGGLFRGPEDKAQQFAYWCKTLARERT